MICSITDIKDLLLKTVTAPRLCSLLLTSKPILTLFHLLERCSFLSPSLFIILPSCMVFDRSLLLWFSQLCPTLHPHGLQYARLPYPSPSPRVCSNPCPLSRLCHPTISFSVTPFSSSPRSFPASVFSNEPALCIRWPKY